MKEVKHVSSEHQENAIMHTDSTYSHSSQSDVEKRARSGEPIHVGPREDDAVTAKTWAVVVVSRLPGS
jgi:hypothetical protein